MVSIIIPTHQRRDLVLRAVESVKRQRFRDWELIVVDDGSEDGTCEAVARIGDDRIRCLRQPRRGVSAARNRGIRLARYDWISFLDSDDSWRPRKLERQLDGLEAEPAYRACFTDEVWIRNGVRVNQKKHHRKEGGWIYPRCLPLCIISPSSILLHRSVLARIGLFDESFPVCEDYEFWLRMCSYYPVLFIPAPLIIKTGGHSDQLSRSRWGMDRFRVRALQKILSSGSLTPRLGKLTIEELIRKARILAAGCEKRGKIEEAHQYRDLIDQWSEKQSQSLSPHNS